MILEETEAEFQTAVIELARLLGYKVAHFAAARTNKGWRTPVRADGKGFPDLCIVGRGRIIFAELKSAKGKLSDEQMEWVEWLSTTTAEVYVWRPDEFAQVAATLATGIAA